MASPIDTFKNNLFGQLKTYGDAVHDAFEQRIARPLLAFKRDIYRSSSTSRTSSEQESNSQATFVSYQQSILTSSSPLEIIDIETADPLKTLLDKFKNAFSSSTQRTTSDECSSSTNQIEISTIEEHQHSFINNQPTKMRRQKQFRHKSVSFAECSPMEEQVVPTTDSCNEIISSLNINKNDDVPIVSTCNDDSTDFQQHFRQIIRPRRVSIGHGNDLLYQDLAAEIVAYVLKHALREVESEEDQFIDLK